MFISILVVILVNSSSPNADSEAPSQAAQRQLVANRRRLSESSRELERLQIAAREAEEIRDRFSNDETESILSDLESLTSSAADSFDQRNSDVVDLADAQIDMNVVSQELDRLRSSTETAQRKLNSAKQKLQKEVELRSRTSKLPRQERTTKQQIPFFVKGGRLCAHVSVDGSGNLTLNERESVIRVEGDKQFAEPIVAAGLAIDRNGGSSEAISQRFGQLDADKHFLSIVVWEDSFEYFDSVKEVAIRLGFKYQLTPLAQNGKIFIGRVQDGVMVQ